MRITVVGAGYVGLVTGACLASAGHRVTCIDKEPGRVLSLQAGGVPFFEPGLEEMVAAETRHGRLDFARDVAASVGCSDAVFLAVGTPALEDGAVDLSHVREAALEVAAGLRGFTVLIVKSTVPVGTAEQLEAMLRAARPAAGFAMASNPEFLREGRAVEDFLNPDRIVVGAEDPRALALARKLFRPFLRKRRAPLLLTSPRSAELVKYASNAFLATKVSFINEIADLCEAVGADVQDVARGMALDARIGPGCIAPGPGYGGSCFPKDTRGLLHSAAQNGVRLQVLTGAVDANHRRRQAMVQRVIGALGGSAARATVAVLGLTFKAGTDDLRESPALALADDLIRAGVRVRAHDPKGLEQARAALPGAELFGDPYACAAGADALVIATEWEAFRCLDLERMRKALCRPVVVDLRNLFSPHRMKELGFTYHSVGRPAPLPCLVPANGARALAQPAAATTTLRAARPLPGDALQGEAAR